MEPALKRDRSAEVELPIAAAPLPESFTKVEGDLKGLVDGVGLEVFGMED